MKKKEKEIERETQRESIDPTDRFEIAGSFQRQELKDAKSS